MPGWQGITDEIARTLPSEQDLRPQIPLCGARGGCLEEEALGLAERQGGEHLLPGSEGNVQSFHQKHQW